MFPVKDNIPTDRFPVVTVTLIALNVLAYFLWQKGGLSFGDPSNPAYFDNLVRYATIPYEITHPGEQCIAGDERHVHVLDGVRRAVRPAARPT